MSMHGKPLTEDELRDAFTDTLDRIVAGEYFGCPTDTGLDVETADSLDALARHPKSPAARMACRTEFVRMLDGTHAREARERERLDLQSIV